MSDFEEVGSAQTRTNTFQPHHSLHRPLHASELSLSALTAAGCHLGHALRDSHPASYAHVYGTRHGVSILDVRHTLSALRTAASVVKRTVLQDGLVLFLGSHGRGIDRAVEENAKRLGENGFAALRWKLGSVSNANKVFASAMSTLKQPGSSTGQDNPDALSMEPDAAPVSQLSLRPSLVIALSPTTTKSALREITAANIPTIGITDSNVDPRCVTYPIPANDDGPRSVELIAGVLASAGQDALQLRQQQFDAAAKRSKSAPRIRH